MIAVHCNHVNKLLVCLSVCLFTFLGYLTDRYYRHTLFLDNRTIFKRLSLDVLRYIHVHAKAQQVLALKTEITALLRTGPSVDKVSGVKSKQSVGFENVFNQAYCYTALFGVLSGYLNVLKWKEKLQSKNIQNGAVELEMCVAGILSQPATRWLSVITNKEPKLLLQLWRFPITGAVSVIT